MIFATDIKEESSEEGRLKDYKSQGLGPSKSASTLTHPAPPLLLAVYTPRPQRNRRPHHAHMRRQRHNAPPSQSRENLERLLPPTSTLPHHKRPQNTKPTTYDLTAAIPQPHNPDMAIPVTSSNPWWGVWTMMVQPGVIRVSDYIFKFLKYLFAKGWNL